MGLGEIGDGAWGGLAEQINELRDDGDFRVLHMSESIGSVTHFLVENQAFHKLGIVHGTAEFLHDLDISKIDDIGFRRIDYVENEINGEWRDEGAGQRAREEKKFEEKRRKKKSRRERERENRKCIFNERRERGLIKNIYIYIYIF